MADDDRPNVLFLLSDQHGYRDMSHRYDGDPPVDTPALDRIAGGGTRFETAYCQAPLCTPSRICLLTGREAQRCGAWENWHRIEPGVPTLPGVLSEAGYETCLQGKMHLGGDRQFVGFDHRPYGDLTGGTGHQSDPPLGYWHREDSGLSGDIGVTGIPESLLQERNVVEESLAWLRSHDAESDDPWFLTASFSRPHPPHTAPERLVETYLDRAELPPIPDAEPHASLERGEVEESTVREHRAAYLACVEYLDRCLDDMLALLERDGLLENTVVVYASDHGEMGGHHGRFGKVKYLDDSTRVPFLVSTPATRERGAAVVSEPVSLADLFPTLCSLSGVEPPAGLDGVDLSGAVATGDAPEPRRIVCDNFTDSFGNLEYRMVREGRWKYVEFPEGEDVLVDLERDPEEFENLAPDADGEAADALDRLRGHVDETVDWGAVRATRRRDEEALPDYYLGVYGSDAPINAYTLPDGRVVEADTPLYDPNVIAEVPERIYDDWPTTD
jgi:choline-sulfatase